MKKRIDVTLGRGGCDEERIGQILNREFRSPEVVEQAKQKAFAQVRQMAKHPDGLPQESPQTGEITGPDHPDGLLRESPQTGEITGPNYPDGLPQESPQTGEITGPDYPDGLPRESPQTGEITGPDHPDGLPQESPQTGEITGPDHWDDLSKESLRPREIIGPDLQNDPARERLRPRAITGSEDREDPVREPLGPRVIGGRSHRTGARAVKKPHRRGIRALPGALAGLVAAAAVFTLIGVSNPALASGIPLVGHVFAKLGSLITFSGDYEKYAEVLEEKTEKEADARTEDIGQKEITGVQTENIDQKEITSAQTENTSENTAAHAAENTASHNATPYSKTAEGVTVTLEEIYCNEESMTLSVIVQSEEPFPDTYKDENNMGTLYMGATMTFSYNPNPMECLGSSGTLEGQFVDDRTFMGIWRVRMEETRKDSTGLSQYRKDLEAFLEERGIDTEKWSGGELDYQEAAALLGLEEWSDDSVAGIGGPRGGDYIREVEIPDRFTVDLDIDAVMGFRTELEMPDMPQELQKEYEEALAARGISGREEDYGSLTEEQKDLERQLFNEMYQKYYELYPEALAFYSDYKYWKLLGSWDFTIDVTANSDETVTKEINDLDENGVGIVSVTKTPVEISFQAAYGGQVALTVVLDAEGRMMEWGTRMADVAIQDRDVSKLDLYICEWTEYMDELRAYRDEENFKEVLEERALHHTEVTF